MINQVARNFQNCFLFSLLLMSLLTSDLNADATDVIGSGVSEVAEQMITAETAISTETFYQMVEKMAEEKIQETAKIIKDEQEMSKLRLAKKIVINKLKQLLPFDHIKEMILKNGMALGIISAVGEVTTSIVLPTLLLSLHNPIAAGLAIVSGAIPSPAYLVPSYFYAKNKLEEKHIARELKINSAELAARKKLRESFLEISGNRRLFWTLSSALHSNREFAVVNNRLSNLIRPDNLPPGYIDFKSLEKIFVQYYPDPQLLRVIKESASSEGDDAKAVRAMMMVKYLELHPEGLESLNQYFEQQMLKSQGQIFTDTYRKNFSHIIAQRQSVAKSMFEISKRRKKLAKLVGTQVANQAQNAKEIAELDNAIAKLKQIDKDIKIFEFEYLEAIKQNNGKILSLQENFASKNSWDAIEQSYLRTVSPIRRFINNSCISEVFNEVARVSQ